MKERGRKGGGERKRGKGKVTRKRCERKPHKVNREGKHLGCKILQPVGIITRISSTSSSKQPASASFLRKKERERESRPERKGKEEKEKTH